MNKMLVTIWGTFLLSLLPFGIILIVNGAIFSGLFLCIVGAVNWVNGFYQFRRAWFHVNNAPEYNWEIVGLLFQYNEINITAILPEWNNGNKETIFEILNIEDGLNCYIVDAIIEEKDNVYIYFNEALALEVHYPYIIAKFYDNIKMENE